MAKLIGGLTKPGVRLMDSTVRIRILQYRDEFAHDHYPAVTVR